MGVKISHKQASYTLKDLTVVHLNKIIQQRYEHRQSTDSGQTTIPTVDIDVSWIMRHLYKVTEKTRIDHIMNLCDVLCKLGNRV